MIIVIVYIKFISFDLNFFVLFPSFQVEMLPFFLWNFEWKTLYSSIRINTSRRSIFSFMLLIQNLIRLKWFWFENANEESKKNCWRRIEWERKKERKKNHEWKKKINWLTFRSSKFLIIYWLTSFHLFPSSIYVHFRFRFVFFFCIRIQSAYLVFSHIMISFIKIVTFLSFFFFV